MPACLFVSDLHGRVARWRRLFALVREERPAALLLGGDLLPSGFLLSRARGDDEAPEDFVRDFLAVELARLRDELGAAYPRVLLILGNDDPRRREDAVREVAAGGLWEYLHGARAEVAGRAVWGYACVPPTPFRLKDWERYDVSRFTDPGCVPPEAGVRSVPVEEREIVHGTIAADLEALAGDADLSRDIFLFHTPPYDTVLDRAALDGKTVDHVPLDVHVGSIAVRRFIEARQPLLTLHGHVHESTRLTGEWRARIGRTWMFQGAHDGPELAVVAFDPDAPEAARRLLLAT